jgi:hypothetical protein
MQIKDKAIFLKNEQGTKQTQDTTLKELIKKEFCNTDRHRAN